MMTVEESVHRTTLSGSVLFYNSVHQLIQMQIQIKLLGVGGLTSS